MNIYEYDDFRSFLADWITNQGGRGTLKKWAEGCSVHSTLMSQIMAGKKEMSLELAERLSQILGLSEAEFDYLSLLVLYSRAGTVSLRKQLERRIKAEQEKSESIAARLKVKTGLDEDAKTVFYSSWLYSGVRNLTALREFKDADSIAQRLNLGRREVQEVIRFLLDAGLCILNAGALDVGPRRTHVEAESPHVQKHHQNWRLKAFEKMHAKKKSDLFFTFPMSLSEKDADKLRKSLPAFVESVHKVVGPSKSETVRCLNIDFFEY